jgi:hypothetical protein
MAGVNFSLLFSGGEEKRRKEGRGGQGWLCRNSFFRELHYGEPLARVSDESSMSKS